MPTPRNSWIPAAFLVALASPAFAGTVCTDLVPPARYQSMQVPAYELVVLSNIYVMHRQCGQETRLGCADSRTMTIYVLADVTSDPVRFPCLMRHEIAHLNGWPGNHPND